LSPVVADPIGNDYRTSDPPERKSALRDRQAIIRHCTHPTDLYRVCELFPAQSAFQEHQTLRSSLRYFLEVATSNITEYRSARSSLRRCIYAIDIHLGPSPSFTTRRA
jgi:hypothetical protein